MDASLNAISTLVRLRRQQMGLTQQELANRAGFAKTRIEALENVRFKDMGYRTVTSILAVLDLHIQIMEGEDIRKAEMEEK